MPIYEYTCEDCGENVEELQKLDDPPPDPCPRCLAQGTMRKTIGKTSFQLKGGGWFKDGYS
jgi:putative FmdB family regulatory protein